MRTKKKEKEKKNNENYHYGSYSILINYIVSTKEIEKIVSFFFFFNFIPKTQWLIRIDNSIMLIYPSIFHHYVWWFYSFSSISGRTVFIYIFLDIKFVVCYRFLNVHYFMFLYSRKSKLMSSNFLTVLILIWILNYILKLVLDFTS